MILLLKTYLENNSAHVVVAGPQLVLRPDQGLERWVDEVVHPVHILFQRSSGICRLTMVHEIHSAVKQGL